MTFEEALKVLNAGYQVARATGPRETGDLTPEDIAADDWYTVDPPLITGTLDLKLEDAGMVAQ